MGRPELRQYAQAVARSATRTYEIASCEIAGQHTQEVLALFSSLEAQPMASIWQTASPMVKDCENGVQILYLSSKQVPPGSRPIETCKLKLAIGPNRRAAIPFRIEVTGRDYSDPQIFPTPFKDFPVASEGPNADAKRLEAMLLDVTGVTNYVFNPRPQAPRHVTEYSVNNGHATIIVIPKLEKYAAPRINVGLTSLTFAFTPQEDGGLGGIFTYRMQPTRRKAE